MWFDSWSDILRILVLGSASYLTLVIVLRFSGKRTLSQLNAYDFIVTVAFGSTLATIFLNADVSLSEGAVALALLAALQLLLAWLSSRRERVRSMVTSQPVVLLTYGQLEREAMRRNRITESEIFQAMRSSGMADPEDVAAVVLETNGKLSVISSSKFGSGAAMKGVRGSSRGEADDVGLT